MGHRKTPYHEPAFGSEYVRDLANHRSPTRAPARYLPHTRKKLDKPSTEFLPFLLLCFDVITECCMYFHDTVGKGVLKGSRVDRRARQVDTGEKNNEAKTANIL
ncbi:hypothetical protein F442_13336 [Phytophthora nicotianae P10297]|uniref:Uncharacterized protein n=1 Tax=Phytophthora nicotianae P10297 TaxID=1317064 RepID=W2YW08_PHYNI|nr:hypothetical protein F442_13336 [Phytophthora nicotianae P10297]